MSDKQDQATQTREQTYEWPLPSIESAEALRVSELRNHIRQNMPECDTTYLSNASKESLARIAASGSAQIAEEEAVKYYLQKAGVASGNVRSNVVPPELEEGKHSIAVSETSRSNGKGKKGVTFAKLEGIADRLKLFGVKEDSEAIMDAIDAIKASGEVIDKSQDLIESLRKKLKEAEDFVADTKKMPTMIGDTITVDGVTLPAATGSAIEDAPYIPHADDPDVEGFSPSMVSFSMKEMPSVKLGVQELVALWKSKENIMLVGPPGTSKTSVWRWISGYTGRPLIVFQGAKDRTLLDFVGCLQATSGSTHWVDGPLALAMRRGYTLVIDEADHMPAECTSILHEALNSRRIVLAESGGEVIEAHEDFRIVATANTGGHGDKSGNFAAAKVQDAAYMSRWGVKLHTDWPSQEDEAVLLRKKYGINKSDADVIARVAHHTRNDSEFDAITLRHTQAWARALNILGSLSQAYAVAVVSGIDDDDDREPYVELFQRFGGEEPSVSE